MINRIKKSLGKVLPSREYMSYLELINGIQLIQGINDMVEAPICEVIPYD